MRLVFLLAFALSPAVRAAAPPEDAVSFYVVGHEDDWQLFMNPPASQDVAGAARKAVFIHLTAGDAGQGAPSEEGRPPFFLARENGVDTALRFMTGGPGREGFEDVRGHRLRRLSYRGAQAYFLRLPDGGDGHGYERTGRQSLALLEKGAIPRIAAVDSSAVYAGWADLVATLRAIIDRERGDAKAVTFHVSETDPAVNPDDHPDHLAASQAALAAASSLKCARWFLHESYHVSSRPGNPANLTSEEREEQTAVFAATVAGVTALGGPSTWEPGYRQWLGRAYWRAREGACP